MNKYLQMLKGLYSESLIESQLKESAISGIFSLPYTLIFGIGIIIIGFYMYVKYGISNTTNTRYRYDLSYRHEPSDKYINRDRYTNNSANNITNDKDNRKAIMNQNKLEDKSNIQYYILPIIKGLVLFLVIGSGIMSIYVQDRIYAVKTPATDKLTQILRNSPQPYVYEQTNNIVTIYEPNRWNKNNVLATIDMKTGKYTSLNVDGLRYKVLLDAIYNKLGLDIDMSNTDIQHKDSELTTTILHNEQIYTFTTKTSDANTIIVEVK